MDRLGFGNFRRFLPAKIYFLKKRDNAIELPI